MKTLSDLEDKVLAEDGRDDTNHGKMNIGAESNSIMNTKSTPEVEQHVDKNIPEVIIRLSNRRGLTPTGVKIISCNSKSRNDKRIS